MTTPTITPNTTQILNMTVLANAQGNAKQYANHTAAQKALVKAGINGRVAQSHMSRRFYIEVLG